MKFGKLFKLQVEGTLPEWRDRFLRYKDLKKLLRQIPQCGTAEAEFLQLLNNEIDKLNEFFLDKEEEFVIRQKELQLDMKRTIDLWGPNGSQSSETEYKDRVDVLKKNIVDLHGEMILLLDCCSVNYTGLAKILEKYVKRTGGLRGLPFIQNVLEHSLLTTELISKLVSECESIVSEVFQLPSW